MGRRAIPQVTTRDSLSDIDRMTFPALLSDTFMSGATIKLSVIDRVSTSSRLLLTRAVVRSQLPC